MSPPSTGLYGISNSIWQFVVLFAAGYINFNVDGFNFVFGLLKLEIEKEYPHIPKQWIALIGSLVPGLYCLLAPVAPKVEEKYGMRRTIFIGTTLQLIGFALGFLNLYIKGGYFIDLLALGVFQGLGSALLLTMSISSITDRFHRKGKALATGLVTAGSPFGAIFYGSFFKTFLQATSFGWRGTTLFFGGLSMINILCGIVFTEDPNKTTAQSQPTTQNLNQTTETVIDPSTKNVSSREPSQLLNWCFFGLLAMTSFFIMGYYVPPLLVPGQSRDPKYGVSEGIKNNIVLIWGVANGIGRILVGFMADISHHFNHKRPYLTSYTIITFCTIICTITMFVFPHVMIYGNIAFLSLQIIYGFFVAGGISLRSVILKELIPGSVATPLAWMYFSDGVFVVIGFCLSAYADTIKPLWAYTFAGSCFAVSVVLMLPLLRPYLASYRKIRREKADKKARENGTNGDDHEVEQELLTFNKHNTTST